MRYSPREIQKLTVSLRPITAAARQLRLAPANSVFLQTGRETAGASSATTVQGSAGDRGEFSPPVSRFRAFQRASCFSKVLVKLKRRRK